MDKELQELFSLPTKLQVAADINGVKVYSSDKLKASFIKTFQKTGRGKFIANQIEDIVKSGDIVPCYLSKGILKFVAHRLFGKSNKSIAGLFHPEMRKVFVLIDNNINIFGTGSSDLLVSTTIHECMHLLAAKQRKRFLSIFKPILLKYYTEVFSDIFQINGQINPKSVQKIYEFISYFEYSKTYVINKRLTDYYKLLEKEFQDKSKLDSNEFRQILTEYIVCLKLVLSQWNVFIKNIRRFTRIIGPLYDGYRTAFGKRNDYTTPIQELIYPSEIASVYSEMFTSDGLIKQAFKALA